MLPYGQAYYKLMDSLLSLYDSRESAAIAHEIMEWVTGLSKFERLMQKETLLTGTQDKKYHNATTRLLAGEPVQYIIGHGWFMGRQFEVNDAVLIPRPETEELVQWIVSEHGDKAGLRVLDVGTGSGCIPVSLELMLPAADVTSIDVSSDALAVAAANAAMHDVEINFVNGDFLSPSTQDALSLYDIIVSNPPYIPHADRNTLHQNVRDYEPSLALFVPTDDALVFYRAIALFGKRHLATGGIIYCECGVDHAVQCRLLFADMGYDSVILRQDMHGNNRMIKAAKPAAWG